MFEIIGLVIVCTGLAGLARGRGKSPVVTVIVAVIGHLFIQYGCGAFVAPGDAQLALLVGSWAWFAVVAGYLRFVIGAGRPKPDSKWSCSNCNYLNNASSIICEACQQPWQAKAASAS